MFVQIIFFSFLILVQQITGFPASDFIDAEKSLDPFKSIYDLCSNYDAKISKISTISWLLDQFESLEDDSLLAGCKGEYLEPLVALNKVVTSQPDDPCSLDKIKLIDEFHWDYMLGSLSKKWTKFSKGNLPQPLKVFFANYATEITNICKSSLVDNLELAAMQKDTSQDDTSIFDANFGRIVKNFQQVLIPFDKIKHYEDFVLVWDMMSNHERKRGYDVGEKDLVSGETVLSLVKVKNGTGLWATQRRCRQILRPVYRNTVLPVMRLIDMGYDRRDKELNSEMKDNDILRDWYLLTQTCELLMPIKFYQDTSMKFWEFGAMDSFEEAQKFEEEPMDSRAKTELSQVINRKVHLADELRSALDIDEKKLLKTIKLNVKNRGGLFRKAMKNALLNTFGKFQGTMKSMFFWRKKSKKQKQPADESSLKVDDYIREARETTDKFLAEDEAMDREPADAQQTTRHKRNVPKDETEGNKLQEEALDGQVANRKPVGMSRKRKMFIGGATIAVIIIAIILTVVITQVVVHGTNAAAGATASYFHTTTGGLSFMAPVITIGSG